MHGRDVDSAYITVETDPHRSTPHPMTATTCLLIEFLPRYGLPMWQLLLLSLYLFAGGALDLLATPRYKRSR